MRNVFLSMEYIVKDVMMHKKNFLRIIILFEVSRVNFVHPQSDFILYVYSGSLKKSTFMSFRAISNMNIFTKFCFNLFAHNSFISQGFDFNW